MSRLHLSGKYSGKIFSLAIVVGFSLVTGSCSGGIESFIDSTEIMSGGQPEMAVQGEHEIESEGLFPAEAAGLHLSGTVKGEEAMPLAVDFLGSRYEIKDTCIAIYNGGGNRLHFWLIEMYDEADAVALIEQMHTRIARSAYFCDHREYEDELVCGYLYYARFCGMDISLEHNFYYRQGARIYWASMSGEKQLSTLRLFLARF